MKQEQFKKLCEKMDVQIEDLPPFLNMPDRKLIKLIKLIGESKKGYIIATTK